MIRLAGTGLLLAAIAMPSALIAQRSRPDVIAPQVRDTAFSRVRAERMSHDVPELNLWSPPYDRFDRSDFAQVFFSVDRDAYVALFEVGTDGRVRVIYPRAPKDQRMTAGGEVYRAMAGGGFYPDSPFARLVPYVFAIASFEPLDLREFGYGSRWRYQLAAGGTRARNPEYTITSIAGVVLGSPDAPYAADYLYFATRAQVQRAYALRALDACYGLGWNSDISFADLGSDAFFRHYFIPMWDLYQPFGGFTMGIGMPSARCGRQYTHYAATTTRPYGGTRGASPGAPTPDVPRTDSASGPRGVEPERRSSPRRGKLPMDTVDDARVGAVAPPVPVRAENVGIGAEPLRERQDREFQRERAAAERREIMAERRRAASDEGFERPSRPERSAPEPREPRAAEEPRPSAPPAAASPSPTPNERPAPRSMKEPDPR